MLILLTGCGGDDPTVEELVLPNMEVRYGDEWKPFNEYDAMTLPEEGDAEAPIIFCGLNQPSRGPLTGDEAFCIRVDLSPSILGSGPATFTLDGSAKVVDDGVTSSTTFDAGPRHTAGVDRVWGYLTCDAAPVPQTVTQQISGTLELTANERGALLVRMKLDVSGPLGGPCGGDAARFEGSFGRLEPAAAEL